MGLLDHDEGESPAEGETHAKVGTGPDKGAPGTPADKAKKQHRDNLIIIVVGLLGVIVTFLIYRKNAAAGSTSTAATSGLPSSSGTVAGSGSSGDDYADQMVEQLQSTSDQQTQAISGLQTALTNLESEISQMGSGPPAGSTPPATQTTAGPSQGYGTISIGGVLYDILGQSGQAQYQVGGGAPVYFGNANGVAQGQAAEAAAAKGGGYSYVPDQYKNLISPTAAPVPAGGTTGFY